MKLFGSIGWSSAGDRLPPDRLRISQLASSGACLEAVSGMPANTDYISYEPTQRLLAVGTADGRVKLFGREGVERSLFTRGGPDKPAGTRQLLWLVNRGGIMRVDKNGQVQLWAADNSDSASDCADGGPIAAAAPLHRLSLDGGDAVTCAAAMTVEPFVLLGCGSGAVRVALMANASGDAVNAARQVRGLKLLPYTIPATKLRGKGEVTFLSASSRAPAQLLLAVHDGGSAAIWDMRAQQLVASVAGGSSGGGSIAPVTAAAWLGGGSARGDFTTGHSNGEVLLWVLPKLPQQHNHHHHHKNQQQEAGDSATDAPPAPGPRLLSRLWVQSAQPARPIRSLEYMVAGKADSLLVLGGQAQDTPDGLAFLALPPPLEEAPTAGGAPADADEDLGDGEERGGGEPSGHGAPHGAPGGAATPLPWFGATCSHCLVPAQGSMPGSEDVAAALVLLEGGELSVHVLVQGGSGADGPGAGSGAGAAAAAAAAAAQVPKSFKTRFQGQPKVTAARLSVLPTAGVPLQGLQCADMSCLRSWSAGWRAADGAVGGVAKLGLGVKPSAGASVRDWRWMVDGGRPAAPPPRQSGGDTSELYCTGHEDGAARLWDLRSDVPHLLGAAPGREASAALAARGRARPVTVVEFCWERGLLVTGHQGGEVRVFMFSRRPRSSDVVHFESVGTAASNPSATVEEPPGFQLVLRSVVHSDDVCSCACGAGPGLLAVGDKAGGVSLMDLTQPELLWLQAPMRVPVVSLALACLPLPPPRDRNELIGAYSSLRAGELIQCVVAVGADAGLGVLDAATGFFVSREGCLRPKHPAPALLVEALDSGGAPTWMARDAGGLVRKCRAMGLGCASEGVYRGDSVLTQRASAASAGAASLPGLSKSGSGAGHLTATASARSGSPSKLAGMCAARGSMEGAASLGKPSGARLAALARQASSQPSVQGDGSEGGSYDDSSDEGGGGGAGAPPLGARRPAALPAPAGRPLGEGREADEGGVSAGGGVDDDEEEVSGLEDEDDIDKLLALAAAQIHAGERARDIKSPRNSGRQQQQQQTLARTRSSGAQSQSSIGHGPAAGEDGGDRGCEAAGPVVSPFEAAASLRAPPSPDRAGAAAALAAAEAPSFQDAPICGASEGDTQGIVLEDPEAAFILVATEGHLRLYTADHAVRCDRTVARRAALPGRLRFAAAFSAGGAPALAALVDSGGGGGSSGGGGGGGGSGDRLLVYSLPGLELVSDAPLSRCCGWHWEWDRPSLSRLPRAAACSGHGHLALLGPQRELLRLALPTGLPPPAQAVSTFDWDVATAAHAAAAAREQARGAGAALRGVGSARKSLEPPCGGEAGGSSSGGGGGGAADGHGHSAPGALSGGGGSSGSRDLRGFMAGLGQMAMAVGKAAQDLPSLLTSRPKEGSAAYPHPDLETIFCGGAASRSGRGTTAGSSSLQSPRAAPFAHGGASGGGAARLHRHSAGAGGGTLAQSGSSSAEAAARRELLGPAGSSGGGGGSSLSRTIGAAGSGGHGASPRSGGARVRTAAEIRAAYGRPSLPAERAAGARAEELGGVMAENRQRLEERGEKLRQLQDKGADLEESAAAFAEMAKQLAERERNKAKWFGLG